MMQLPVTPLATIPVAMPPVFVQMAGIHSSARFIGIYYKDNNAFWDDGQGAVPMRYFHVYQPLVQHPAIAFYLEGAHLGNDDRPPTHLLIFDRQEDSSLLMQWSEGKELLQLQSQPPRPPTVNELKEIDRLIAQEVEAFNRGRWTDPAEFGIVSRYSDPRTEQQQSELLCWLDRFINKQFLDRFISEEHLSNPLALMYLRDWLDRIRQSGT